MSTVRRVLVTGSSRGIGRAIAVELCRSGYAVTLHGRVPGSAVQESLTLLSALGHEAECLFFDVSDRESARRKLTSSIETHGPFYGVVLNAGITRDQPFPGLSDDDWDLVLRTNLDGFYNVLHPLVMPMIGLRSGGRIVCLSSVSGMIGNRGQVNYSASKAGIIGAVKALSKELAKRKISVNCVAPGFIDTDMVKDLPRDEVINAIPMKRSGKPEEVASLVSYLFSDMAGYITGQVISISGGLA
jgi:3-oxoacyl-[acyl-carrier protein] reductase